MIICPNCNHQNPEGAVQCEACYTPLPAMTTCPSCGAAVQTDASFCGQCGFDLRSVGSPVQPVVAPAAAAPGVPPLVQPEPLVSPDPLVASPPPVSLPEIPLPEIPVIAEPASAPVSSPQVASASPAASPTSAAAPGAGSPQTLLQQLPARLLHIQTNATLELPLSLSLIHIGKPNDRVPPDLDVSGFPDSEIVSRIHADIRVEAGSYFIEDVGSSNGTYINNVPLPPGNRHRLRAGDRISLGKGDKVTFLFQFG